MAEMRWGFIGASIWASRYLIPAVHATPDAQASAIYSTSAERGAQFVRDSKLERSYATLEELLADPTIDAVYISTTNDLHASQTIAAAKAGKHVLCEKPMAITLEDAIAMQTACLDAGVILAIDHHLRGAATIQAMRQSLASGAIGELVAARVFHAFSLPEPLRTWPVKRPETGAGVILDITVHDADTIMTLTPSDICSTMRSLRSRQRSRARASDRAQSRTR